MNPMHRFAMSTPFRRLLTHVSPLALSLVLACGDDSETKVEQDDDSITPEDAGSDGSDDSAADAGASGADDLAAGKAAFVRSCGFCHGPANMSLNVLTADGSDVNEEFVAGAADAIIARLENAEAPMPPAFAMGPQAISDDERAQIIAYVRSL